MWLRRLFRRYHLNSVHCNLSDCLIKFSEKHGWRYEEDFGIIDSQVNKGFYEGLANFRVSDRDFHSFTPVLWICIGFKADPDPSL
jgi:hypothetical protein